MIWFYWGNKKMSFLRYMALHSACALNDDVTLIRRLNPVGGSKSWQEKQDSEYFYGEDYTSRSFGLPLHVRFLEDFYPDIAALNASEIHTSDILAWTILSQEGGTIADMDIVFTKPVPKITRSVQLVRFQESPLPGYTPVSFMQGRPHNFWKKALDRALESYDPDKYESCGSECLPKHWPLMARRLPSQIVFPWADTPDCPDFSSFNFTVSRPLPKESIGVHWYAGNSQSWNNWIDHENLEKFKCTVTDAIRVTYAE